MANPMKAKLETELQQALQELKKLDERLEQKAEYGPGKGDPAIYDWEFTLALRQQAQQKVGTIRHALQRLADGNYGVCERCGKPIDPERLEIVPLAHLCIECAKSSRG